MLTEYSSSLDVYYTVISPENLKSYEDILIKIFDPIFNTEQRLKEQVCNEYEKSISAKLCDAEEAFSQINMDKTTYNTNNKLSASLGFPEKAF